MNDTGKDLPLGWCWTTLGEIAEIQGGIQKGKKRKSGVVLREIPYLRVANVQRGYLDLESVLSIGATEEEISKLRLQPGDVLFNEGGDRDKLGRGWVWRGEIQECIHQNHVFRARLAGGLLPKLLSWYGNSEGQKYFFDEGKQTTNLASLNSTKLKALPLLVPPLPEQHRIVEAIESYFTRLEDAEATLERVQRNLKRYGASVLKAAVEGRLVPTEAELARGRKVEAASRRFLILNQLPSETPASTDNPTTRFFIPSSSVGFIRGNLPHWQQECVTYYVTFRLADSLPAHVLQRVNQERDRWLQLNPKPHSEKQTQEYHRFFAALERNLDRGYGSCLLRSPEAQAVVRDALLFFDGDRYLLHDWVIMPNHVHLLLTTRHGENLSKILHSIKSFTAKKINQVLGKEGKVWQKESFDHIVRSVDAFERFRGYIKANPSGIRTSEFMLGVEREPWTEESLTRRDAASTFEPASVLLERILAERRRRWEEAELAKMKAKGKPPKNVKWKAKYKEPVPPDTTGLPELPEGWCWASVDMVAALKGGVTKGQRHKPSDVLREVPYLRVANVQRGFLDLSVMKTIRTTEAKIAEVRLEPGDVLFNEGGDRDKLGRGWIWSGELPECIHQNHVFRARIYTADLSPKFLSWYGNTAGQQYFFDEGKQTTNLASINLTKLKNLPVPIPPLAEQRRMVGEIERLLSLVDAAEAVSEHGLRRCTRLRQAILKWAFEGKLADQDPDDEPASVLLDRIRAGGEAIDRPKRGRPRKGGRKSR